MYIQVQKPGLNKEIKQKNIVSKTLDSAENLQRAIVGN